jgi:hypothetical protein
MKKILLLLIASSSISLMGMQMEIDDMERANLVEKDKRDSMPQSPLLKTLLAFASKECDAISAARARLPLCAAMSSICNATCDTTTNCYQCSISNSNRLCYVPKIALLSAWRIAACSIDCACLPLACAGRMCKSPNKHERNNAFCFCTRSILAQEAQYPGSHRDIFSRCIQPHLKVGDGRNRLKADTKVSFDDIEITLQAQIPEADCCDYDRACGYARLCCD